MVDEAFTSITEKKLFGRLICSFLFFLYLGCEQAASQGMCLKTIEPQLREIEEQLKEMAKANVSTSGPRTQPGACTLRLAKIAGTVWAYVGGPAESERNNAMSRLELKKVYLRQECDCKSKKLDFSDDGDQVDQTIKARERLSRAQKQIRKRAISNPLIRKWIDEASKVRDCYSLETTRILNDTAQSLEKLLENP